MTQAFGRWLLGQALRDDAIGVLAKQAKADQWFPIDGSPEDVRQRLRELQAEGDVFALVDDAEMEWLPER